ncbi:unnamed protein product, partial [Urochloa humidicola]
AEIDGAAETRRSAAVVRPAWGGGVPAIFGRRGGEGWVWLGDAKLLEAVDFPGGRRRRRIGERGTAAGGSGSHGGGSPVA